MYTLKNGILYDNGKPVIMLGTSYYPSFHKLKYPTPPEGDRIGEMKRDLADMREFGFNHVRVAALGKLSLNDKDEIVSDTGFIDELLREADRDNLSTSVRLQGYVTDLRGNTDYLMVNEKGEPMDGYWTAFITASLFHEGINRDTDEVTCVLSEHFAKLPGVIALQTYNEPHYPYNGIFDYHPAAVAAYKRWLVSKGLPESEPPRKRPERGESTDSWVRWRLFSMEAMSGFLNDAAELSVKASGLESFTCATSGPVTGEMMDGGLSYFGIAERMDIMGITTYIHYEGADYYSVNYVLDLAECAAATFGKHAWTVEADARTHMPGRKLAQSVYGILGAGHKGINYYEWRGDYPAAGSPHPDNCGFIFNDHSKTGHYEQSKLTLAFVNKYSTMLAMTEKHRDGFGILYSEHAFAKADANHEKNFNRSLHDILSTYREARKSGFSVSLTRAEDLERNPLAVRLLIVPYGLDMLSEEEKRQLDSFAAIEGNAVYCKRDGVTFSGYAVGGYWKLGRPIANLVTTQFEGCEELDEVTEECGIQPFASVDNPRLHPAVLDGEGCRLVTLVNSATSRRAIEGAKLILAEAPRAARFLSPEYEADCAVEGSCVLLPRIEDGGIVKLDY